MARGLVIAVSLAFAALAARAGLVVRLARFLSVLAVACVADSKEVGRPSVGAVASPAVEPSVEVRDGFGPLMGTWETIEPVPATMVFTPSFSPNWLDFSYNERSPGTISARGLVGYISATKQYVMVVALGQGALETGYSTGWQGDTMTWEGEAVGMMGQPHVRWRSEFITKGASEFWMTYDVETPEGWSRVFESKYRQQP